MNYIFAAILLALPFFSFCHHSLPNWWNSPHQSLIGMGPIVTPSSDFKVPDLTKLKKSHHGVVLRENGKRYIATLHINPQGGMPEISGIIFPSGQADKVNFYSAQLEEGKDRTWIRLLTKPAQEVWRTRQSYSEKLELETRLSFIENAEGSIYIHPTSERSAVYSTEPSEVFKAAQGRWISSDAGIQWDLNLNRVEGNYLKGSLTSTSSNGTCEYQAIATTAIALNRYLVFTTEDQSGKADCPAHTWEVVIPESKEPSKFEPTNSVSPALTFSRR